MTTDISSETLPDSTPTFADLGLLDVLVDRLSSLGYETPTPIQARAIPTLLEGKDVVGLAQTGTGKTAAFALPILQKIDPKNSKTQAIVLAPTRELALQVCEAITTYAINLPGIRVLPVYGGQGYGFQLQGLQRGAHIVVGTPGRVIDHLERGSLDLTALEFLVLDEADEMLNMGFAEDVERILADTPEYKQVALFSATMPKTIRGLAKKYLHDPVDIATPKATTSTTTVRQRWIQVSHHHKLDALTRLLEVETGDGMIVFVRTKSATEEIAEKLRTRGYTAAALNGDLVQAQRERTVAQLKSGQIDVIVATDVAARGLDVERITHVVNYDIPHDTEAYVHRIGRTGRAGRTGEAILFVTPRERRMLSAIEKVSGRPVEEMSVPSAEEVNERRAGRFAQAITSSMGSPTFHAFRSLVEEYASENDVSMTDVAAALAVMSQTDKEFFLRPDPPKAAPRERSPRRDDGDDGPGRKPAGYGRSDRLPAEGAAVYRVAVGKRHKVGPSAIVGALANEGSLKRSDFGKITIGQDHTLVELPADLPDAVFEALANTRISGRLINLERDSGPPIRRTREDRKPYKKSHENRAYPSKAPDKKPAVRRPSSDETWEKPERKPRHK
ncbi:DEAD/DEAH box helicase [Aeromicrobium fastidiosum]|uniref:ATP-dependent RNA helicase DeaD n=1 Tax=Aeromicrobium fastidiosum TaxID=52699 RepID=A0A641AQ78_9ACTN|nr:DEAD/DEAH box helicase [Aeromicrobium fastidiosum]KAA1379832.1 DEAD/DEAH box helicase [Aeromicrobium fastidiosum]MBP2389328.1 ATP-dependent RNA helicase DeaD [Aeromicrobium fastidiosum]